MAKKIRFLQSTASDIVKPVKFDPSKSTFRTCTRENCSMCKSRGQMLALTLRGKGTTLLLQLAVLVELLSENEQVQASAIAYLSKPPKDYKPWRMEKD